MKKVMYTLSLLMAAVSVAAAQPAEALTPQDFNRIVVEGNFTVHLSQGAGCRVVLDADYATTALVEVVSKKGVLTVGYNKRMKKALRERAGKVDVHITVAALEKLTLSGGCTVVGTTAINTKDLTIKAEDATVLQAMNVVAKSLSVSLEDASRGEFTVQGAKVSLSADDASSVVLAAQSVARLSVEVDGASSLDLSGRVSHCRLNMKDASTARGTVHAGDVGATLKGGSTITIDGSAEEVRFRAADGSIVNAERLLCNEADVSLSGTSSATVHSRRALKAALKGACRLQFMERNEARSISSAGKFSYKF